jgi:hypothetical protein
MITTPRIHWRAFSVPKLGNRPEENEDACLPEPGLSTRIGEGEFQCAVSDGATSTSFSGLWARLLVSEALARPVPVGPVHPDLAGLVASAQARWRNELAGLDLPWHAEEKVRQGAFATLAWFGLRCAGRTARSGGDWQAVTVGDSCIFQIRAGAVVKMAPVYCSADFARAPLLLSSVPARNAVVLSRPAALTAAGRWAAGDEFLLMTDALAGWFVRETEKGACPLDRLKEGPGAPLGPQPAFARWVQTLRENGKIKNDDTTLAWITLDGKPSGIPPRLTK